MASIGNSWHGCLLASRPAGECVSAFWRAQSLWITHLIRSGPDGSSPFGWTQRQLIRNLISRGLSYHIHRFSPPSRWGDGTNCVYQGVGSLEAILEFCLPQLLFHNCLQGDSFGNMKLCVFWQGETNIIVIQLTLTTFALMEMDLVHRLTKVRGSRWNQWPVKNSLGSRTPGFSTILQVEFMLLHFFCSQVNEVIFGKVCLTAAIYVNKGRITDSLSTWRWSRTAQRYSEGFRVARVFWPQRKQEIFIVPLNSSL